MKSTLAILFLAAECLAAQNLQLAWNASPTPNVNYVVYGYTNNLNGTNIALRSVVGTNCTATITYAAPATWLLFVTAQDTNSLMESPPSNVITVKSPQPPSSLVPVILSYAATLDGLGTNSQNLFFKLKVP